MVWLALVIRQPGPPTGRLPETYRGRGRAAESLRAQACNLEHSGRLRANDPAGTMTRRRATTGWDRARNKAPWSGRGSWATRSRNHAAVERRGGARPTLLGAGR